MTRAVTLAEIAAEEVLTVDSTNSRIGIGSTQPTVKLDVDGVVVATAFTGDGSGLTGIAVTDNIVTGTAATFTGGVNVSGASNIDVTGVVTATTFSGNITGVAATFTGDVTIGGELTYEDVTNVDSVGFATFRKGINVQGAGSTTTTLNVTGVSTFGGNVSIADSIFHTGDTDTAIRFPAADTFTVETAGSEAIRVDSGGRLVIGSSGRTAGDVNAQLQVEGTSFATSSLNLISNAGASAGNVSHITLAKSRGSADGSNTIVANGDNLGSIQFAGADGTDINSTAALINAAVDGAPGSNDMPGRLMFHTTTDGASSPTERLRITSTGGVHFSNAELIERVNIVANKLSAVPNVNLDNGMVHYYTTNETTTANPNIITTAGINTNMATGDTMSVTIMSKPNSAGYFPRISIDGRLAGITTYWNGGSAPSSAQSSGVDANTYQIIKTADATFDVLANTSNFA